MSDFRYDLDPEKHEQQKGLEQTGSIPEDDLIMEQILQNLNNTPIGQVLKKITSLPEVRKKKILTIRRQLTEGRYDINKRLDAALDKVIEDLII
jgi:hypothetical protein